MERSPRQAELGEASRRQGRGSQRTDAAEPDQTRNLWLSVRAVSVRNSLHVVPGRFMIETSHGGRPWIVIVEPDGEEQLLVVTAYEVAS